MKLRNKLRINGGRQEKGQCRQSHHCPRLHSQSELDDASTAETAALPGITLQSPFIITTANVASPRYRVYDCLLQAKRSRTARIVRKDDSNTRLGLSAADIPGECADVNLRGCLFVTGMVQPLGPVMQTPCSITVTEFDSPDATRDEHQSIVFD